MFTFVSEYRVLFNTGTSLRNSSTFVIPIISLAIYNRTINYKQNLWITNNRIVHILFSIR